MLPRAFALHYMIISLFTWTGSFMFSVTEKIGCSVEHDALVREFMHGFMHENALNPMIYPSLRLA